MKCHILLASAATALVVGGASAQSIYSANFNVPPYTAATIVGQQTWVAGSANTDTAANLLINTTFAAQQGNGSFKTTSYGGVGTAAAYSADQTAVVAPFSAAIASGAQYIDTSFYVNLAAAVTGSSYHQVALFALLPGATSYSYMEGVRIWAGPYTSGAFSVVPGEATVLQYLAPPTVATAGNYQIKFPTPVIISPGSWNQFTMRWNPVSQLVQVKVGAGEFVDFYATDPLVAPMTANVNRVRVTASFGVTGNAVPSTAYFDTLDMAKVVPAFTQCNLTAGPCETAHSTGGCKIIACCEQICGLDPSCCTTAWSQACVDLAIPTCGLFVYNCTNPNTPSNNCAISPAVIVPSLNAIAYDTSSATTDGPPQDQCGSGPGFEQLDKDIWWRFQATTSGTLVATNCNTGTFDSKIAAYNIGTNLANFNPQLLPDYFIGCNEDCGDPTFNSSLSVAGIVAGNYYLVRLGGYGGASGSGTVSISVTPPPNPCDPANLIIGSPGVNIVTSDALYPDLNMQTFCNFPLGSQNIARAKFIKFTPAASGSMQVDNCADTGATVDCRLAAMTSCGVVSTTIGCDDDGCTGAAPYTSKLIFNVTAGVPVYIAVGGYNAAATGPFNILITPPAPPACPADLNQDGVVNGADLGLMLGSWGPCPGCPADLNADGVVNGADLGLLLGSWGPCV